MGERIDTIIYDVDGTLVDGRRDIAIAMNRMLREMGIEEKPFDRIVSCMGGDVGEFVACCLGKKETADVEKATEIFQDYFIEHPADESTLFPHVRETLEHFGDLRQFVITNRSDEMTEATLRKFGIRDFFEGILGAREDCGKPSSCPLDRLSAAFRIEKESALLVGDMATDIEAGREAGTRTCWVTYGLGKRDEIVPLRPDFIIDDLAELKEILGRHGTRNEK